MKASVMSMSPSGGLAARRLVVRVLTALDARALPTHEKLIAGESREGEAGIEPGDPRLDPHLKLHLDRIRIVEAANCDADALDAMKPVSERGPAGGAETAIRDV